MNLVVDCGNTQIKIAVFEHNSLLFNDSIAYPYWQNDLKNYLKKYPKIKNIIISSVGKIVKEDFLELDFSQNCHFISQNDKFPFQNLYKSPETLGMDRMILASGAVLQFPNKHRLVIDAGTCITYDFIDENNNYLGGAIAPGLKLRYQSLHTYTAKLPLLTIAKPEKIIGNSTNQAIHSGVVNGAAFEIEGFISDFCHDKENFIIILTGGDTNFLAKRLKNTIFANSNFLLESLNQTFQYNQND